MMLSVGDRKVMALADTGTSEPILGPELVKGVESRPSGGGTIQTPTGARKVSKVEIEALTFGEREFKWPTVMVEDSLAHHHVAIVGASILFASTNTLFTKDGFYFDVDESSMPKGECVQTLVDLTGNTFEHPIAALYFLLRINGVERKVLFDTGFPVVLMGTAKLVDSSARTGWSRPNVLLDPGTGRGKFSWARPEKGVIELGEGRMEVRYLRQSGLDNVNADFFMGSGILDFYSILITPRRGRACFIKNPG
jgi:hypothetical protein